MPLSISRKLKGKTLTDNNQTIYVKNMVCNCCIRVISDEFEKAGLQIEKIELGSVTFNTGKQKTNTKKIREILNRVGFDIITERDHQIVEKIKLAVIELIHHIVLFAWTNYKLGKLHEAKVLFYKALLNKPTDKSAKEGYDLIK